MDPKDPRRPGSVPALPPEEALARLDPNRDYGGKSAEDFVQEANIAKLQAKGPSAKPGATPEAASNGAPPLKSALAMFKAYRSAERRRRAIILRHTVLDCNGTRKAGGLRRPLPTDPTLLAGNVRFKRSRPARRQRPKNSERRKLLDELLREGLETRFAHCLIACCQRLATTRNDMQQLQLAWLLISQYLATPHVLSKRPPPLSFSIDELVDPNDEAIRNGQNQEIAARLELSVDDVENLIRRFDRTVVTVARAVLGLGH